MAYQTTTIINIMQEINHAYYLPSIQRKFVWDVEQIENLFDSLMQNYPIGTFLFWAIEKGGNPSRIDNYTFYEFIDNYNEKEALEFMQKKVEKPSMKDRIIAVLDGQQRLSSLYCALKGSYAFKTNKKISPDNPYPKRELYLNLLYVSNDEMQNKYQFRFLTESEASEADSTQYWLKVKDVISWAYDAGGRSDVKKSAKAISRLIKKDVYADLTEEQADDIESKIEVLWERIVIDNLITYFEIKKESLDDILDIFVRVNSAGTPLSRSDLVFSTIVANWEDGREKIEALLETLNAKGNKFKFNKDFIITLCLALMDLPQKFQVKTFTKENVEKVSNAWGDIQAAINDGVQLLVEFGFNHENLTASYIIIPVTYYLFKSKKRYEQLADDDKGTIRKFIIAGMVKRIFSASVESGLTNILNKLKKASTDGNGYDLCCSDHFDYDSLKDLMFQGRTLKIEETDIDEILNLKKGDLTFMILSLLYPELKLGQIDWHQDHIHPKAGFEKKKIKATFLSKGLTIDKNAIEDWMAKANTLVNLQLLKGKANQEKSSTPLQQWIMQQYPDEGARKFYCESNYIDIDAGFGIENFDAYYSKRRERLAKRIIEIFDIAVTTEEETRLKQEQRVEEEVAITPESETIAEAALKVLSQVEGGLTCQEIYERIMERKLYNFKAENPIAVLKVELRRRCENVEISKSFETKYFRIIKEVNGESYYGIKDSTHLT